MFLCHINLRKRFFFFFHLRKLTGFQFISVVSVVNISLLDIIAVSLSKDPQTPESMTHFMQNTCQSKANNRS